MGEGNCDDNRQGPEKEGSIWAKNETEAERQEDKQRENRKEEEKPGYICSEEIIDSVFSSNSHKSQ